MAGDQIWWVDADGKETELTNHSNLMVLLDQEGMDMPPFSILEEEGTGDFKGVETNPREVDLLIAFCASSATELRTVKRSFLSIFNPFRGHGRLKVQAPNGSIRELNCIYKSGLEGVKKRGESGKWSQKATLTFQAFDPYWYDTQERGTSFQLNEKIRWFPLFPIRFGGIAPRTEVQIVNEGDVDAFPMWTIHGPGMNPRITNVTTGQMIALNGVELDATQSVTIRILPREAGIQLNDGTDLFSHLSFGSTLWWLKPGRNIIQIEMPEATDDSRIDLAFRLRYLGV